MPDSNFELELDRFNAEFTAEAEAFAPQIAEQLLADILRQAHPYWSGRSMASWVVSLEEAVKQEQTHIPKKAGAISEEEARQISLNTLVNLGAFILGDTIFLTQGTEYLAWIEEGTWGSSPGFVAAAVSRYYGLVNLEVTM